MSPIFISTILGVAITVLTLGQVAPSITSAISSKNIEVGMDRETVLTQQILRYRAVEGSYPATVTDLVGKNYWTAANNTNGFGGSYTFTVDGSKNQIAIRTTIADAANRLKYINNYRHVFKPVDLGAGVVLTTFIIPGPGSIGSVVSATGSIPVSTTAPSAASNRYWYDTSGTTPALKVSDGTTWIATASATSAPAGAAGIAPPSASNTVANSASLPVTATTGDVRYVYNAATSSLDTMFYYNGIWAKSGTGTNAQVITALAQQTLPVGNVAQAYYYDLKASISAMFANTFGSVTINPTNVTWTVQGVLPDGLGINTTTGILSGTPTTKTMRAGTAVNVIATYSGNSGQQTFQVPVAPPLLWVSSIATGDGHTCALTTSGGVKCWGRNNYGQLGDGTTLDKTSAVDVIGLTSGVLSLATGRDHNCAITTAGGVKCWGYNGNGQLGDGTTVLKSIPVNVAGLSSGISSIALGGLHTCALTSVGGIKCWGYNSSGQLGDGTITAKSSPIDTPSLVSGVAKLSAGFDQTCAITTSGGAKCWGFNTSGQVGDGTIVNKNAPVDVNGLASGVANISIGSNHACALTTTGGAKCWGSNDQKQFGGVSVNRPAVPFDVPGLSTGLRSIFAGNYHTCGLMNSGVIKCWGWNTYGQVGPALGVQGSPADLPGFASDVYFMTSGYAQTCAVSTSSGTKCVGFNVDGQLGDGTLFSKTYAVNVLSEPW